MPGKPKGLPKTGGREKGTQNKSTEEAKKLFIKIMSGNINKFKTALDYLYKKDKIEWLKVINKFFPYYLPRQQDITSGGESIKQDINISVINKKVAEDLKKLFDADD